MCISTITAKADPLAEGEGYKIVHRVAKGVYRNYWGEFRPYDRRKGLVGHRPDNPGKDSVYYRRGKEYTILHNLHSASDDRYEPYLAGIHVWPTAAAVADNFPMCWAEDSVIVKVKWRDQIVANSEVVVVRHMTIVSQITKVGGGYSVAKRKINRLREEE